MDSIAKRISTIADIELDEEMIGDEIEDIKEMLKTGEQSENIDERIKEMHDYILEIINKETMEYMKLNGLYPISQEYLPTRIGFGIIGKTRNLFGRDGKGRKKRIIK